MDLATIVGIFAGMFLIAFAITKGGGLEIFIHFPSMLIVGGGTLASTLVHFPLGEVLKVLKVVQKAFLHKSPEPQETITTVVEMARKVRREGVLALESQIEEIHDPFLKRGVQLIVDGTEPELIQDILSNEITALEERHKKGQQIFSSMGAYAPAFGMIGTLIGLIQMLRTLEDPTKIGIGMATALITTFYGALLANLLFLPIAGKLKTRSEQEILTKEMILTGLLAIQSGDTPRIVQDKMTAFLAPKYRQELEEVGV
ncbi:MAG TPA: motility protein A [Candidatus Latescibacteria bacterium]|nr:motility protein A [Candidatus Latescibacterota bacterium]